ncbi:hypothetical protein HRbin23_01668 [bacterium HR23]|nr:hypothetical protein HRbin23_01668 [bacterium HR23]
MRKKDMGYPWGVVEVPPGFELVEVDAACGADDHFSHPFCDPRWEKEVEALGGHVVFGPIYDGASGWVALVAVPRPDEEGEGE